MQKKLLLVTCICLWITVGADRLSAAPTTIARGAKGPAVSEIQRTLNSIGVAAGPVDGVFGPSTEKAVRLFQSRKKLPVDGVVGPRTRTALADEVKAAEKRRAEQQKLEEKRVLLEELKKRTLDARQSPPALPTLPGLPALRSSVGVVYLTLDDGPDPQVTPVVLDILRRRGARATFFVIGKRAEEYPDLTRRMVREGHSVQNHSYAHEQRVLGSTREIEADMALAAKTLNAITGTRPRYYRPPYGDTSAAVFEAAHNQGHTVTLWSNIWGIGPESIVSAASDGSIIMMNERLETVESLPAIIERLSALGYRFGVIAPAGEASPSD